ncbi:unnamed protein product [Somion occarium]|uniref:Uncharacterized protein n=1 Tax=Somion occarium TaxID=3059160 RepID=A0ABP1D078_9APHY
METKSTRRSKSKSLNHVQDEWHAEKLKHDWKQSLFGRRKGKPLSTIGQSSSSAPETAQETYSQFERLSDNPLVARRCSPTAFSRDLEHHVKDNQNVEGADAVSRNNALLAKYGIKVRDFAYESTLPHLPTVWHVPEQIIVGPKRRRPYDEDDEDEAQYAARRPYPALQSQHSNPIISGTNEQEAWVDTPPVTPHGTLMTIPPTDEEHSPQSRTQSQLPIAESVALTQPIFTPERTALRRPPASSLSHFLRSSFSRVGPSTLQPPHTSSPNNSGVASSTKHRSPSLTNFLCPYHLRSRAKAPAPAPSRPTSRTRTNRSLSTPLQEMAHNNRAIKIRRRPSTSVPPRRSSRLTQKSRQP